MFAMVVNANVKYAIMCWVVVSNHLVSEGFATRPFKFEVFCQRLCNSGITFG